MNIHARQSFLGPHSERDLENAKVAVIGACGGGSHVVQQLAHAGIGFQVVIDPQRIDATNLNRMVGATRLDVWLRRPKVKIARRVIRAVRPRAKVLALQDYWQAYADELMDCDVIVGCLDSVRAKNELEAFCRRFLIPYIDIGMDVHGDPGRHLISGQVILSMPGTPCLQCLGIITEEDLAAEAAKYGAAGGLPQVVWPNGVLASTAVGVVMQVITPWYPNPPGALYLHYDGNTGCIAPSHRLAFAARTPCLHYPAAERGDPLFDIRKVAQPANARTPLKRPKPGG